MSIGVVLNVFKRPENVLRQLEGLSTQTLKPDVILIWVNGCEFSLPDSLDSFQRDSIVVIKSSENLGVWARFTAALNLHTTFINVLDDDIIPGPKWLEHARYHCLKLNGLIGGRGVRFYSRQSYNPIDHWGWKKPNEEALEVDIIGHSWFFRREWLNEIWNIEWRDSFLTSGEDMNLSFKLLTKLNIRSYVAPHPLNDLDCWSNVDGEKVGSDTAAISRGKEAYLKFDRALSYFTENESLKLFYERDEGAKTLSIRYQSNFWRRIGFAKLAKHLLGSRRYQALGERLKNRGFHF